MCHRMHHKSLWVQKEIAQLDVKVHTCIYKNQGLPATEGNGDELVMLALEEVTTAEDSLVDDEFGECVFASQYDSS